MKTNIKRTISLLLVLVMCISILPASALAEETEEVTETAEATEQIPEVQDEESAEEEPSAEEQPAEEQPTEEQLSDEKAEKAFETEDCNAGYSIETPDSPINSVIAQGTCGDSITWVLDSTGVMKISGTGSMYDYNSYSDLQPWYWNTESIKSLEIAYGVTGIGAYAFDSCKYMTSVSIPDSLVSIGRNAFKSCSSLTTVTIPDSVTSVNDAAFSSCSGLTSVVIGKNVTNIGNNAFGGTSLTSVTIPDSVTSLGTNVFAKCTSLTSVKIGNSVTSLGDSVFSCCESLTSVTVPDSITSIESKAFYNCTSLTGVEIGSSVTSIDITAFERCYSLQNINVSKNNNRFSSTDGVLFNKQKTTLVLYPSGRSGDYTVPDGVERIYSRAFYWCNELTTVKIGSSVTSIGESAFADCESLTTVKIGNSVTSIGESAFHGCYELTTVEMGNSINTIGVSAFENCYVLASVKIPDSVTEIGSYAFSYCDSLSNIIFMHDGDQPLTIGEEAFYTESIVETTVEVKDTENKNSAISGYDWSWSNRTVTYKKADCWEIKYILGDDKATNTGNPCEYTKGKEITLAAPELTGSTFAGWYTDEGLTEKANAPQIKAGDTGAKTFYAKWNINSYSIKFNSNGGNGTMSAINKKTVNDGELTVTNKFKRTGYKFTGWNTVKDGTGESSLTMYDLISYADAKKVIMLYAQWEPITYTVMFYSNGGSGEMAGQKFTYGTAQTLTKNGFTRTGYNFNGWTCGSKTYTDEKSVNNLATVDGDTVKLTAQWKVDTGYAGYNYTIKFIGGDGISGRTANEAMKVGTAKTLTANGYKKTGYSFAGWSTTEGGEIAYTNKQSVKDLNIELNQDTGNDSMKTVTLYAVWTPNEYSVSFNGNGGKLGKASVYTQSMTYDESSALDYNQFIKTGYTFKEWNTKSNGKGVSYPDGAEVQNLTAASKGKVTLYAIWTANTYTIKYDGNGAKSGEMTKQAAVYGSNVKLSASTLVRPGFSFAGWSADGTAKVKYKDKSSVKNLCTEDGDTITLTAVWTTNTYTVKFNANKGKGTLPVSLKGTGDDPLTIPENNLTFTRYAFREWNTKADGTGDAYIPGETAVFNTKNKATVTLYAVWTYDVTLNSGIAGGEPVDIELTYGRSETVAPKEFTKTGYYIAGWSTDEVKAENGTVQYKINAVKNVQPGSTLYAVWKPITYTVRFHINNGINDTIKTQKMTYDKETALTANSFSWKGHKFEGWSDSSAGTVIKYTNKKSVKNMTSVPNGVVELYAVWS